jgi:hypothetical protein
MPQFNQTVKNVSVPTGGGAYRVWDNTYSAPVKNLTILVRSVGVDATKLSREVFFGGYFTDVSGNKVSAYAVDSIHVGGISQAAAAAVGTSTSEAAYTIYSGTGILPANVPGKSVDLNGYPVVVEFKNTDTVDMPVEVIFITEVLSSNV